MSRSRSIVLFLSLFGIPTLLLGFQNCAPNNKALSVNDSTNVGIVDDFQKSLQFVSPEIGVQSEVASTDLSGFCARSHGEAELSWSIWSSQKSEHPILSGKANCKSGLFSIQVDHMDKIPCGVGHVVMVQGDWGGSTYANVVRRCVPLASESVAPPQGSPYGTECSMEFTAGEESGCSRVCYRDNKVVFNQRLDVNQCSGLLSKVAGG